MRKSRFTASIKKILSLAVIVALLPIIGYAKEYSAKNGSALPPEVIEGLQKGEPQDLIVNFDSTTILQHQVEKQKAKGLLYNDEQITGEVAAEIAALKESVFPQGRLNDAVVKKSFTHLPTVIVTVPTLQTLEKILADPRVDGVYKIPEMRPDLDIRP